MTKNDPATDLILESLPVSSPLAEQAVHHAFKRIKRRKSINRAACVMLPLASAILFLVLLLPNSIRTPKDDLLTPPAPSPSAQPEWPETETVYVSQDDPYYHAFEKCACIKGKAEPLMERVARLNSRYPCPVCCDYETKQPLVEAMAIGDVVVLRYEDDFLYQPELTGVFGYMFPDTHQNVEALSKIPEYLHGKAYSGFLNESLENQSASFMARTPDILYLYPYEIVSEINDTYQASLQYGNQIELYTRHIGSSRYALYFPDFEIKKSIGVYSRVNGIELNLSMTGDKIMLTSEFTDQTVEEIQKLDVRIIDKETPWHTSEAGSLAWFVYHTGNEYVLVIKERNTDPYLLESVTLRIGETEFIVNGFMDSSDSLDKLNERNALYAIVLTEYEANSIKNGADIVLEHMNFGKIAEESPYAYIPLQYGTGAYGVMNKNSEFVIAPEYKDAWSYQDLSGMNVIGVTGPIVLRDFSDTLYIYNGETLEQIAWYSMDGANSAGYAFPRSTRNSFNVISPSIYELRRDEGVYLLNRAGEVLMSFLYDKSGNFENNLYYSSTFLHETVGYPDRIVLYEQKGDYTPDRMWIADLNGNRISRDFERLIPLTWSESRALFITVTYDRELAEKNYHLPYYEKGLPFSGYEDDPSFRLGLVDQNGNEVAECKYIALEIIEDQLYLTKENGEVVEYRIDGSMNF